MSLKTNRRYLLAGALASCAMPLHWPAFAADKASPSLLADLGRAIAAMPADALSDAVRNRMVWTVLDNVGATAHGARLAASKAFITAIGGVPGHAASGTDDTATILGSDKKAPTPNAAAASAYVIHADEVDDSDSRGSIRASAVIFSSTLAAAEALDVDGPRFLEAAALGYTIQGRLAAPVGPIQGYGWMASGVWGPIGAAGAIARMNGLTGAQTADAMAIAASDAGGLFQYFYDQAEEKRLIVARKARTAIESARWAAIGEHVSTRLLEGKAGVYRTMLGPDAALPTSEQLSGGIARLEGPLHLVPKFYSASASIIPTLDGLTEDIPASIDTSKITEIVVKGSPAFGAVLIPKLGGNYTQPETAIGARINFAFVVAMFLIRRSALPDDYTPALFADPEIDALARRIRFEPVDRSDTVLDLEVAFADGTVMTTTSRNQDRLAPAPLHRARREAKFAALCDHLSAEQREKVAAHCRAIVSAPSMRGWSHTLAELLHP